jgi:hypothetical protein
MLGELREGVHTAMHSINSSFLSGKHLSPQHPCPRGQQSLFFLGSCFRPAGRAHCTQWCKAAQLCSCHAWVHRHAMVHIMQQCCSGAQL